MKRKTNDIFGESDKKQTTLFEMRLKKLVKNEKDFSMQKNKNETEKQPPPKEDLKENDFVSESLSKQSSRKTGN